MDEKPTPHQGHAGGHSGGTTTYDQGRSQQGGGMSTGTVNQVMDQAKTTANQAMEQAKTMARNIGEQARSVAGDPGATAQELARRAREQATAAGDVLYRQGQRAGDYLSQNVNEYPLAALLVAGMIGYGLAYLIHTQWTGQTGWSGRN
jgi:vacuolar-type H+-ATPase subunit H